MQGRSSVVFVAALVALGWGAGASFAAGPANPPEAEGAAVQALLSAVGTLSGANAYATFVAIGELADGWVEEVYTAEQVTRVAGLLKKLAETSASGLEAVLASGVLHEDDRGYVQGMIEAYGLLAAEAGGLASWIETGERKTFDEKRGEAWKVILRTLALPEEEALE